MLEFYQHMDTIPNFIVFEGGDGSGTTTQLKLLKEKLKKIQTPVFFPTNEPTDSQTGKLIRAALKKEITLMPETLCFLFAADRNEHLYGQNGILERCSRGELVVSDRFVLSSLVYQEIECGDDLPVLLNSRFPAPEITFFFDVKPEIALERLKNRTSVELYEHLDFQENARKKYIAVLEKYRKISRVEIIDASKSVSEVASLVWSVISQMPILKQSENIF
jgi:dTMP kinase